MARPLGEPLDKLEAIAAAVAVSEAERLVEDASPYLFYDRSVS
jgi:hypothetical protein